MTLRTAISDLRRGVSLAGTLLAIVLVLLVVDFVGNSFMFERANTVTVNSEETSRLAEHLLVARRVVAATPAAQRAEQARQLSTRRFQLAWQPDAGVERGDVRLTGLRNEVILAERELGSAGLRMRFIPTAEGGGIAGSVQLPDRSVLTFRSLSPVSWSFNAGLLLRFSLPSLLLLALAWMLVRGSFKPLNGLVSAAAQVGTDDMILLPETGQREVRQLIRAFNTMHQRIHQLLTSRTQTLLAIGHDLRTPLARLQLRVEDLAVGEDRRAELSADITEMAELLASLQAFVVDGRDIGPLEPLDLAAMVQSQVDDAADRGLEVRYRGPARLEIRAHPSSLRRAIGNLLQNALRYAGNAEVTLRAADGTIELEVADNGPGIPPDRIAEVIQPFIRLDEARARNTGGMGLGLAIVDRIVRSHGGDLVLANRAEGGLSATIRLPRQLAAQIAAARHNS